MQAIKNKIDKIVHHSNLTLLSTPCSNINTPFQGILHQKRNPLNFMNQIFPVMKKRQWKNYFVIKKIVKVKKMLKKSKNTLR